ncbi:probable purine permease 4 [Lactuca sativa]|uniref:probable purine permease 4 n=1 Tax=Lactuca sativa TaxID=4236 RepID=UPI000CD828E5|nr:probable purine permease 4 [Lactuca sativa]
MNNSSHSISPMKAQVHVPENQQINHSIFTSNKSKLNGKAYKLLLAINYICLFVGSVASSLLLKFYFNHKGSSRWVSTWVQSVGFPLLLIPIYLPYYLHCFLPKNGQILNRRKPFSSFDMKLLGLSFGIGLMLMISNLCFSWGNSYLPLSTSSLVLSSQLVFTLLLSVIIVKQKITFLNLNCVILLTLSCVLLALSSKADRPEGLTPTKYLVGFFSTVCAGLLFALYLPLMEKIYSKVDCYAMVMEMQFVMEATATAVATLVMALAGGFKEMRHESVAVFDLGPTKYWVTVGFNVVTWQLSFMGVAGMVFLTTSLTGGICMTALMAMNVIGGVVVYGDDFKGQKVVSTMLCLWGFCSYVYGMYLRMTQDTKENNNRSGEDTPPLGLQQEQKKSLLELSEIVTEDHH